ncbi:MAG: hypothetical protein IT209_01275 [Armatimonadetes bacterium]|nr:hypothetical protein [Armatimonadota bacterium]
MLIGLPGAQAVFSQPYGDSKKLADITAPFLAEISGIAASRNNPGIYWVHNDSGDGAYVYAISTSGEVKGVFLVRSAGAVDWEDIAWGPGPDGKGSYLYLGDIGNNDLDRCQRTVYRIPEPKLLSDPGTKEAPHLSQEPTIYRTFSYPDHPHNSEAMAVHPQTGDIYIITKEPKDPSTVYKLPRETEHWWEAKVLTRVGQIDVAPDLITGADISPDGKHVAVKTYLGILEFTLPDGAKSFDDIWKSKPQPIAGPVMRQAEAICYSSDGDALLLTSEQLPAPLYEMKRQSPSSDKP